MMDVLPAFSQCNLSVEKEPWIEKRHAAFAHYSVLLPAVQLFALYYKDLFHKLPRSEFLSLVLKTRHLLRENCNSLLDNNKRY